MPAPSVADLVLRQLWEAVSKLPNSLHVFILPKLIMPVWEIMMFKIDELVLYGPPGGGGSILDA